MTRSERCIQQAGRVAFVGCSFCGAVDRPLRNVAVFDPAGKPKKWKICPECRAAQKDVQIGHREGENND